MLWIFVGDERARSSWRDKPPQIAENNTQSNNNKKYFNSPVTTPTGNCREPTCSVQRFRLAITVAYSIAYKLFELAFPWNWAVNHSSVCSYSHATVKTSGQVCHLKNRNETAKQPHHQFRLHRPGSQGEPCDQTNILYSALFLNRSLLLLLLRL